MKAYLINLARRPDRLSQMQAQLGTLGLPMEVVTAVDARDTPDAEVDRRFTADGPLGPLPKGDKCCTLSHMRAWELFLTGGDSRALFLEDDVLLDGDAVELLRDGSWIPSDVGLLKIERFGPANQRVLLEGLKKVGRGRQIGRLRSKHTGAAAYILGRATARMLLDWPERWSLPVDHMLFNPNNSPLVEALRPYQLTPVIARQTAAIGGATDIDSWRKEMRKIRGPYLKRALVRGYYELRPLPRQVVSLLVGKFRLVRVEAEGR